MKKWQVIAIAVVLLLFIAYNMFLSPAARIAGTWEGDGLAHTFSKDGTYSSYVGGVLLMEGTYTISGKTLEITYSTGDVTTLEFKIADGQLTLTDEYSSYVLDKK